MISVITVTYGNFLELKSTLQSIWNCKNIESIIVNGGDCPETINFLRELEINPPTFPLTAISEPDRGIADAFNKGVKRAQGEALVFLNSGDLLTDPLYFEKAGQVMDQNGAIGFVHSDIVFIDSIFGKLLMVPRRCRIGRGMPYHHQTMIVRKEIFHEIGGFDIKFKIAMDYDFVCRMQKISSLGYYYVAKGPVVQMDGKGVAATKELLSIKECYKALRKNNLLTLENRYLIFIRFTLYLVRRILLFLGLKKILFKLKIKKNEN